MQDNRISSVHLNQIIGNKFKVLDNGFIRVVDYMGGDESIVQAARVSYGKGTRTVSEDRGLIRYLMRHHHTTPFEMCEIKFHIRVPMDCWRQWIRHRTANVNEYSTRYSIAIDSAQSTKDTEWRSQSNINKQGSGEFIDQNLGKVLSEKEYLLHQQIREVYEERIANDVAREQARKDLPLSTYTEAYWKIDLHNLFHFLALRMDGHAQYEIRSYANIIGNEIVSKWCPLAWQAFVDYRLNAQSLSAIEISLINLLIKGEFENAVRYLVNNKLIIEKKDEPAKFSRELNEIVQKFEQLGIAIDWNKYLR